MAGNENVTQVGNLLLFQVNNLGYIYRGFASVEIFAEKELQVMNRSDITTLIHFNLWANGRILTTCDLISPDEFTRQVTPDPGWGSLRSILVHTLDTEYGWRSVLQSHNADNILKADNFANVAALKARWAIEEAAWNDYVAELSEERLKQGYGNEPQNGPRVWQVIMHVVAHGIQHRSEAAAILTGYGRSPGELDFDVFLGENPEYMVG